MGRGAPPVVVAGGLRGAGAGAGPAVTRPRRSVSPSTVAPFVPARRGFIVSTTPRAAPTPTTGAWATPIAGAIVGGRVARKGIAGGGRPIPSRPGRNGGILGASRLTSSRGGAPSAVSSSVAKTVLLKGIAKRKRFGESERKRAVEGIIPSVQMRQQKNGRDGPLHSGFHCLSKSEVDKGP